MTERPISADMARSSDNRLKVWMSGLGTEDRLIAAPSQRVAAEAFGMSLYEFRNYASETGNTEDRALALANPGTVFMRSNRRYGEPWVPRSITEVT